MGFCEVAMWGRCRETCVGCRGEVAEIVWVSPAGCRGVGLLLGFGGFRDDDLASP